MIIARNLAAMNAQRQFNIVGLEKKKSTEKLSSGYKINRAADDAAGLTISESIRTKIRALNQGSKNTMDGISWIQVADGALTEGHDMMHRLKELAIHAANGTLTDDDREAIDRETQGILDEIHRMDMSTQFNTEDVFMHGDVMFEVKGEPGDLEVYDAVVDGDKVTYGGFLFHGERISFDDKRLQPPDIVRMVNGKQVFNVNGEFQTATITFKNDKGEFFSVEVKDGDEVPNGKRKIDVTAKKDGMYIDGHKIEWNQVKDEDGNSVDPYNPKKGTISVPYGNAVLDITIGKGCSLRNVEEFCDAINHAQSVTQNGGVSYKWITELEDVYKGNAIDRYVSGTFVNVEYPNPQSKTKRYVDNAMAYDSHSDVYDDDLKNGKIEYKLVAELVEKAENKLIHDDLNKRSATSKKGGIDVNTQDIRLYLVGTDGNEVEGSSRLMSELVNYPVTDWTKGTELSDGDSCGNNHNGTITSYASEDNFTDKVFEYVDLNGKTDISIKFRLSEVAAADSIAYNVELLKPGEEIQDIKYGLNGTLFTEYFKSDFSDKMSLVSGANPKVTLLSASNPTYNATYDANIALGRDFNNPNGTLAKINGTSSTQEGKIEYNAQHITFSIMGNKVDKSSTDFDKTRDVNTVDFLSFDAYTGNEEADFVRHIINNSDAITKSKISTILSGAASDVLSIGSYNETINLQDIDKNVFTESGLDASNRQYSYGYNYSDLMNKINADTSSTERVGEKITIKMSDASEVYSSTTTDIKDKYLKLKENYRSQSTGSYINAEDLISDINGVIKKLSGTLSDKGERYVYNALGADATEKSIYLKEDVYEGKVSTAVSGAKAGATLDNTEYTVLSDGSIKKTDTLRKEYTDDYKTKLDAEIAGAFSKLTDASNIYFKLDSDGNKILDVNGDPIPLSGDDLKTEVLKRLDSSTDSFIKNKINGFASSDFSVDAAGKLTISATIPASEILAEATKRANADIATIQGKQNKADSTAVFNTFLNTLNLSDGDALKTIIKENINGSDALKGSFALNSSTLDKIIKSDAIAAKAKVNAVNLGTAGYPEASNLKDIFKSNYALAVAGIAGITSDEKKSTDAILNYIDSNWASVKNNIVFSGKAIKFKSEGAPDNSPLIGKLREALVAKYTDNNLKKIEAYYGKVEAANLVDSQVSRTVTNGVVSYDTSKITTGNTKLNANAATYASNAMDDIAKSSEFTLKTAGKATVNMSTKSDPGEVAYARYESDIEIKFEGGINIQHSNDTEDYTTINQFCFNTAVLKISNINLSNEIKARKAIDKIDYAISYISEKRSLLGATQNRLEHTYRNNQNKEENLTAAESRIRDTDMAAEVMKNTKLNILEQVMSSVMAQANQSTQGVLSLLR